MGNLERALKIRDLIFSNNHAEGRFASDGAKEVVNQVYTARWLTPFSRPAQKRRAYRRGPQAEFDACSLPYKLELTMNGGPAIILLAWSEDDSDIRLFYYRNGSWENVHFWLPYKGRPGPRAWELKIPSPALIVDLVPLKFADRRPWYFSGTVWGPDGSCTEIP